MDVEASKVDVGEDIWLTQAAGGRDTGKLGAQGVGFEADPGRLVAAPCRWQGPKRQPRRVGLPVLGEAG